MFFSGLNVCLALCFNTKLFFTLSLIVSIIGYVITYLGYGMILFRKDGKGLHDLLSGTEVMEVKMSLIKVREYLKQYEKMKK